MTHHPVQYSMLRFSAPLPQVLILVLEIQIDANSEHILVN